MDDDVTNALLPVKDEDKDKDEDENGSKRKKREEVQGGLNLDELVKEGDYSNGIIVDDEDYD